MPRNARKSKRLLHRLRQIFWIAVAIISLAMAVNETLPKPILPTWDALFSMTGLHGENVSVPDGELLVTVLDVGNADAILLQSGDDAMLIDAGETGDGDTVLSLLNEKGIDTLDYVIATHADSDHIGGMQAVLEGVKVENYIMSFMPEGYTPTSRTYMRVLETLDARDIPLKEAVVGDTFALGEAAVHILGPVGDFEEKNNQSVICKVVFGNNRFLFMGDAEREAETALLNSGADMRADVLKVGHHGGKNSTSEAFLKCVQPTVSVLTCGMDNAYGHPHTEALRRLRNIGTEIYRSDVNGTICMRADGETVTVTTQKGEAA